MKIAAFVISIVACSLIVLHIFLCGEITTSRYQDVTDGLFFATNIKNSVSVPYVKECLEDGKISRKEYFRLIRKLRADESTYYIMKIQSDLKRMTGDK